jgi:glycosyltransferase involved in cell wall biosynthesis
MRKPRHPGPRLTPARADIFRCLAQRSPKVCLVDLPSVTPPYDHALSAALAGAGADVELLAGRPLHGTKAGDPSYRTVSVSPGGVRGPLGRARKLAHLPGVMATVGRHARRADIVHYQWLGLEELASRMLPRKRPRVLTAHDILPRRPRRGHGAAFGRLARAMDAVVVHSEHGAERLRSELGVPPERIRVIPHGAFTHLTELDGERPLPAELAAAEGPVVLFFGFLSPYKGVDVLLDALQHLEGVEAWIVGMPRVDLADLRERAERAAATVRIIPRFVEDEEIAALFRRADVVVLPYREIEQSGVLYTALAFERPLVVTRVGGLAEVADRHDLAVSVPPEDPEALAAALARVVHDPAELARLARGAKQAARSEYSWARIARLHLELYGELTGWDYDLPSPPPYPSAAQPWPAS